MANLAQPHDVEVALAEKQFAFRLGLVYSRGRRRDHWGWARVLGCPRHLDGTARRCSWYREDGAAGNSGDHRRVRRRHRDHRVVWRQSHCPLDLAANCNLPFGLHPRSDIADGWAGIVHDFCHRLLRNRCRTRRHHWRDARAGCRDRTDHQFDRQRADVAAWCASQDGRVSRGRRACKLGLPRRGIRATCARTRGRSGRVRGRNAGEDRRCRSL